MEIVIGPIYVLYLYYAVWVLYWNPASKCSSWWHVQPNVNLLLLRNSGHTWIKVLYPGWLLLMWLSEASMVRLSFAACFHLSNKAVASDYGILAHYVWPLQWWRYLQPHNCSSGCSVWVDLSTCSSVSSCAMSELWPCCQPPRNITADILPYGSQLIFSICLAARPYFPCTSQLGHIFHVPRSSAIFSMYLTARPYFPSTSQLGHIFQVPHS